MIDNATTAIDQRDIADKTTCCTALRGNLHLLQESVGFFFLFMYRIGPN